GAESLARLAAIGFLGQVFALPTWGYVGTILAFVVGGMVVGAVSMGMVLGHWYLVTPRLPERPLREMTFFLLLAMGVQALLIIPALALPRDTIANAVDTPILENPFFWMREGGGLAFPMLLSWMAYDSSGVRALLSATGLLDIAMALVLTGAVLAKGLLFVSAVAIDAIHAGARRWREEIIPEVRAFDQHYLTTDFDSMSAEELAAELDRLADVRVRCGQLHTMATLPWWMGMMSLIETVRELTG